MSHVHSGDDTSLVTSVTHPDDGDNADAASVNTALEPANDGVAYLASRLLTWEPSTVVPTIECGSKVAIGTAAVINETGDWTLETDSSLGGNILVPCGWLQHDIPADGPTIAFQVSPPHAAAKLKSVSVRLDGGYGVGHGVLAPATPLAVTAALMDGASVRASETETDVWGAGGYDVPHLLTLTVTVADLKRCNRNGETLWIIITGEHGANAVADTTLFYDITCTWTSEDAP